MKEEEFILADDVFPSKEVKEREARIAQLQAQNRYFQAAIKMPVPIQAAVSSAVLANNNLPEKYRMIGAVGAAGLSYMFFKNRAYPPHQLAKAKAAILANTREISALRVEGAEEAGQPLSGADLAAYDYLKYHFSGVWGQFMGQPAEGFSALIWGLPGAGKSTFAIRLAEYCAQFGKVIYFAAEEGFSATLKQKAKNHPNLFYHNASNSGAIMNTVQGFDFVFIDSVNYAGITDEEVEYMKKNYPLTSFITVHQATKDNKFKGSQEYAHNTDIVIKVENGVAITEKNRFAAPAAMEVFTEPEEEEEFTFEG